MVGVFSVFRFDEQAPLFDVYKAGVVVLFEQISVNREDPRELEIASLLKSAEKSWLDVYKAEQIMAPLLPEARLRVEFERRLFEASRLGVQTSTLLRRRFEEENAGPEVTLSVYQVLLDELHFRYEKLRLDADERSRAALRLNWIGATLLLLIVVATLAVILQLNMAVAATYHQLWVVFFGVIGAYLSRNIHFGAQARSMDFADLNIEFSFLSIFRRLLAGAIGAIVLYCLIRGQIIGGTFFPNPDFKVLLVNATVAETPPGHADFNGVLPLPTSDFAKLLSWSVIAGFSERFIPDQFERSKNTVKND